MAFARRAELISHALNKLDGVTCPAPKGAFYAFANITGTGFDAKRFQDTALEEYGVALVAGTAFGSYGEGYVRLSCANSDEAIAEAIGRLDRMIQNAH